MTAAELTKFETTQELRAIVDDSNGGISKDTILKFAKSAGIKVAYDLIDSEVREHLYQYYGLIVDHLGGNRWTATMKARKNG